MKHGIFPTIIALLLTLGGGSSTYAQNATLAKAKPAPVAPITKTDTQPQESPTTVSADTTVPLTIRKQNVEKGLSDLMDRLNGFSERTQTALDRLSTKGIDTAKASNELVLTNMNLREARENFAILTTITITDDAESQKVFQLKELVKKIEGDLRDASTHLINSLTELKSAVDATTTPDNTATVTQL